jgi:hypothetical protein
MEFIVTLGAVDRRHTRFVRELHQEYTPVGPIPGSNFCGLCTNGRARVIGVGRRAILSSWPSNKPEDVWKAYIVRFELSEAPIIGQSARTRVDVFSRAV